MRTIQKLTLIAFWLGMAPVLCFSQTLQLEDSRQFYTDIDGHHGVGRGTGGTEEEALRIAKSNGLETVFRELQKDDMFVEIFISRWPEAIMLENSVSGETADGKFDAVVRVKVDQQAVLLTEQTYQDGVLNLLNRAENILDEVESRVDTAGGHEENMRLGEAYTNYKQAETRLDELELLLHPLGDSSLQSDRGNSKPAIVSIAGTLSMTVESGLERLAEIEKETEVSAATEEIRKTYALLTEELMKVQIVVDTYLPLSPFYDLQRSNLDAILEELEQSADLNEELGKKLAALQTGVPKDKVFLIEKIGLSVIQTEQYGQSLDRLSAEVKQEIKLPRLVRQERAYKWNLFKEDLGYALLERRPQDIFTLRYYLPFGLNTGTNTRFGLTREFEIEAAVEYYFNDLVWFQTALWKDDLFVETGIKDIALSQEAHVGFGRGFFAGGGGSWDWGRWVKNDAGTEGTARNFTIDAFIGGIDREQSWPWGILMVKVPLRPGVFVYGGKINIALEMKLRIATLFQIEAGISSGYYNIAAAEDAAEQRENLDTYMEYQFRYFGLFGVRLPKPFLWGLRFEGGREGPSAPEPMLWCLFLQYSL